MDNFWETLPKPFFILAPMEAVTDVVFRHVIAAAAPPDVYFTEFTNSDSYCSERGEHSTRGRLEFTPDEQPIVAHIWGDKPENFAAMAKGMAEKGFAGVDINMGCPAPNVAPKGKGSGLIHRPGVAGELVAAAKEGGLPVSVKTRLGYSRRDEWRDWLTYLFEQDVANLTIHLRTKKEMSKVPAHYELIPEIKRLRDRIAPQTLLTINGDIRDRRHGEELVKKYGVDGVMIGRGVFHNPFAFEAASSAASPPLSPQTRSASTASVLLRSGGKPESSEQEGASGYLSMALNKRVTRGWAAPASEEISKGDFSEDGADRAAGPVVSDLRANSEGIGNDGSGIIRHSKVKLLALLHLHLDLFDKYSDELEPRKYEPLKRFFKIYVREFEGAGELREQLMRTKSTDEARSVINNF